MKRCRERGNSIIEFSLLTPWLFFLFIGAMDWGFYAYSLIATESAARVACLYTSSSAANATDNTTACTYALKQLVGMPNVGTGMSACAAGSGVSASSPVGITTTSVASGADSNAAAQVDVYYMTPVLIPMGGNGLPKQVTIHRTVQMRIRG